MHSPPKAMPPGLAKAQATRRAEKEEGMAFARAWREANRGRDWSLEPAPACCPTCNRVLP